MARLRKQVTKDQLVSYITDTLVRGRTKKEAYSEHIDGSLKQVYPAIQNLENTDEFKAIYTMIASDDNMRVQVVINEAKLEYAMMVRKNMGIMGEVYRKVEGDGGNLKQKAAAVRLGNETIQAMAVVGGNNAQTPATPGGIDKSGAIING